MERERQKWLMRVVEAAGRAAGQVDATDSPYHRELHADLLELHDRLLIELEALDRDA